MSTDNLSDAGRSERCVEQGGVRCPVCQSADLVRGSLHQHHFAGDTTWRQIVRCRACHATWLGVYGLCLTGITDIEEGG